MLSNLVHNSNWGCNQLYVRRLKLSSQVGLPLLQFPRLPGRRLRRVSKEGGGRSSHCSKGKSFGGFASKLCNPRVTLMEGTHGTWLSEFCGISKMVNESNLSQQQCTPANRKVIRGIGGVPEGSSLAIPSIAREGGDLPPPPTTGRNSLRSACRIGTTRNQDPLKIIHTCLLQGHHPSQD